MAWTRFSACIARLLRYALAVILACLTCSVPAAQERYDYDALGRLIRVIDEQGRVTEYVYDAAGNILQVTGAEAGSAPAPVIAAITPTTVRRNRVRIMQVTGSGLQGVRVSVDDPALDISNVTVSPASITFTLAATAAATLGNHTITFANAAGTAQGTITVAPMVDYVLAPNPLALPPDNVARQFYLTASEADTEPITFTASIQNPAVARPGNVPIIMAAGQMQTAGTVTGVALGTTQLLLSSPAFVEPIYVTVYVTADAANAYVARSKVLGVVKGNPMSPSVNTPSGPVIAPLFGIVKGDPASPPGSPERGPAMAPILGVVKGDPDEPSANTQSGPVLAPNLGVIKGDPSGSSSNTNSGPVLTPILGIEKP